MDDYLLSNTGDQVQVAINAAGTIAHIETLEASASATLDFTGFDATKYESYLFKFDNILPSTDGAIFEMLLSNDGGSTYVTTASSYNRSWNLTSAGADAPNGGLSNSFEFFGCGTSTNEPGIWGDLELFEADNAATNTTIKSHIAVINPSSDLYVCTGAGLRMATEVNDGVRFRFQSGDIASGAIRVYGIKG